MLKLKKLCSVTLCLVCTGLVVLPTAQGQVVDARGGIDLNNNGYIYNVRDLQPGDMGFTNALLTDYVINLGQLVGHYADGVAITNALDLLPYVGQSLEVTDADGQTMISLSETGIYLYDEVLMEFVPITVTNGQLFFNGNAVGEPTALESLTLIDEGEAASEVILSVDGGALSVDGSPVNTDNQALSATGLLISLENGGTVNLSNAVSTLAAAQDTTIADTDDQGLSLDDTTLNIDDGTGVDLGATFATDDELSTEISNLGTTYATTEEVNALNNLALSVYGDDAMMTLVTAPTTWPHNFEHSHGETASMILRVSFTTGADVTTRQILWEIGGGTTGAVLYIENGELRFIAGGNTTVRASGGNILSNTDYIVTTVVDGIANTVEIYAVDSLNYAEMELVAQGDVPNQWHGTGDFGLGSPSTQDGAKLGGLTDFTGTGLDSADVWTAGGVIGATYNALNYGDVAAGDLVSHQGILYRSVSGTVDNALSPDQDATNWEAISQDTTIADDQGLSLDDTMLNIDDGTGVDLDATFATDDELSTEISNLGSTYATTEEVNALNILDVSVYGDTAVLELETAPDTWPHNFAHTHASTASIILRVRFTTGADVTAEQIVWEIGGSSNGSVLYLSSGELRFVAGSTTDIHAQGGTLEPMTEYIVTTVVDGTANTVEIYMVDSLNYIDMESHLIASASIPESWHGSGAFGLGSPSTPDGAKLGGLANFAGAGLDSADVWTTGGEIGATYNTFIDYGDVAAGDLVSHQGILYRSVSGTADNNFSPDQDATNWEAITQDTTIANTDDQTLSLSGTILTLEDGGAGIDLAVIDTDTKLTETEVDDYVSDNGYLTEESDDQALSFSGTTLTLEDGGAGIDLGATFATDSELSSVSNALSNAAGDFFADGSVAMTGDLDMDDNNIDNVHCLFLTDPSTGDQIKLEFANGELQAILVDDPKMQQIDPVVLSDLDVNDDGSVDVTTLISGGNGTGDFEYEVSKGSATLSGNTLSWITATDVPFTLRARRLGDADYFTSLWYSWQYEFYTGLVFPVTETKFISTQSLSSRYGRSVALDGDIMAVGASDETVHIYTLSGGEWIAERITPHDGDSGDEFGSSVAVEGDLLVVGARESNTPGGSEAGSIYIYERIDGTWTFDEEVYPAVQGSTDWFGTSVSIDDGTIVVGASRHNGQGAVYVYTRSGDSWAEEKLTAPDAATDDNFGIGVDIDGGRIIVGASGHDQNGSNSGTAYVFTNDGGSWTGVEVPAADGASGDAYGLSVAVSGDTIAIGARNVNNPGTANSGAVYVYNYDGSSWVADETVTLETPANDDRFGTAVDLERDSLLVGASGVFVDGINSGAAYVFKRSSGGWIQEQPLLSPSDRASNDSFGSFVALSGTRAIVSAYRKDGTYLEAGAVYLFE